MARRFGDVAPVQLERLIYIDTLSVCAGSVKPSAAQLHTCGRARIREAKAQASCELREQAHGLATTETEVNVVFACDRERSVDCLSASERQTAEGHLLSLTPISVYSGRP